MLEIGTCNSIVISVMTVIRFIIIINTCKYLVGIKHKNVQRSKIIDILRLDRVKFGWIRVPAISTTKK